MTSHTVTNLRVQFPAPHWPSFVSLDYDDNDSVSLHLNINARVHWFKGHFPSQPVLAGVVQTHWAGELGKYVFPDLGEEFRRVDNLKFQNVILPDRDVTLSLNYVKAKNSLKFRYSDTEHKYSQGTLVFAAHA